MYDRSAQDELDPELGSASEATKNDRWVQAHA